MLGELFASALPLNKPAAKFTFLLGSSDRALSMSASLLSTRIALPTSKPTSLSRAMQGNVLILPSSCVGFVDTYDKVNAGLPGNQDMNVVSIIPLGPCLRPLDFPAFQLSNHPLPTHLHHTMQGTSYRQVTAGRQGQESAPFLPATHHHERRGLGRYPSFDSQHQHVVSHLRWKGRRPLPASCPNSSSCFPYPPPPPGRRLVSGYACAGGKRD